jgi:hypothetical protein
LPDEGTGGEETAMTDPEREHFVRLIHDLQGRLRRWRLACLVLLGLLLLPVVLGGLLGVARVPLLERQRARAAEAEMRAREALEAEQRAIDAEQKAKMAELEALQQAERRKALAEEEARRHAQQGPGEGKE